MAVNSASLNFVPTPPSLEVVERDPELLGVARQTPIVLYLNVDVFLRRNLAHFTMNKKLPTFLT